MLKEKEVCTAHELLLQNFASIQKGQSDLYALDREKAEKLGVIEVSVARLEVSTSAGFDRLEKQSELFYENTAKEIEKLSAIVAKAALRRRWTPRAVIALVSSIFGSGGIGYALAIKVIGGVK